jgi:biopolymer transport protein ExbB
MGEAIKTMLDHGGFAIWLILISFFILAVFGTERIITLYMKLSFNSGGVLESIRGLVMERKYADAIQVCNQRIRSPEIQVVKAGLLAVESGREAMKSALGGAVLEVSHEVEKRVPFIALIANVATLLGLLGTISGLIKTFKAIADADPALKAKLLGIGISEAMYATAAGLGVGILAMVLHTICTSKGDSIIGQSQDAGLRLVTWIEQSERTAAQGART